MDIGKSKLDALLYMLKSLEIDAELKKSLHNVKKVKQPFHFLQICGKTMILFTRPFLPTS